MTLACSDQKKMQVIKTFFFIRENRPITLANTQDTIQGMICYKKFSRVYILLGSSLTFCYIEALLILCIHVDCYCPNKRCKPYT